MDKENGPMMFSALPYTPHEMENAMHPYELPQIHYTVVRVAKGQMGIAGDDSWEQEPRKNICWIQVSLWSFHLYLRESEKKYVTAHSVVSNKNTLIMATKRRLRWQKK